MPLRRPSRCQAPRQTWRRQLLAALWLLAVFCSGPMAATVHLLGHASAAHHARPAQHAPAGAQEPLAAHIAHLHCALCDALHLLDAALPPAAPWLASADPAPSLFASPSLSVDTASARWFEQRAPPARA